MSRAYGWPPHPANVVRSKHSIALWPAAVGVPTNGWATYHFDPIWIGLLRFDEEYCDGDSPAAVSGVNPQYISAPVAVSGREVSAHRIPAVSSDARVVGTYNFPLAWSR